MKLDTAISIIEQVRGFDDETFGCGEARSVVKANLVSADQTQCTHLERVSFRDGDGATICRCPVPNWVARTGADVHPDCRGCLCYSTKNAKTGQEAKQNGN